MEKESRWPQFLRWLVIVILQLIMTQVITFVASLVFPGLENLPQTQPVLFLLLLGLCYSIGIILIGFPGMKIRLIFLETKFWYRVIGTLVGVFVPLFLALLFVKPLGPNGFYFMAMFTGILGFFSPEWVKWGR